VTSELLNLSIHFTLEELAKGVYAVVTTDTCAAFGNAGIIDTGKHTIVFDTFETPIAAEDRKTLPNP